MPTENEQREVVVADILHEQPPTAPITTRGPRLSLVCIDVLRGLAAFAVVIFHLDMVFFAGGAVELPRVVTMVVQHGWLGVSLFFVVSGFCIHLPYALASNVNAREYLLRRFFRIWPPYAAVVIVGGIGAVIAGVAPIRMFILTLGHLFFLPMANSPIRESNIALWSVVVEVQLYLIYLAIRLWSPRRITLLHWTIGFSIVGLAYHLAVTRWPLPGPLARVFNPRFFALTRMGEWLCGAVVADLLVRHAIGQAGVLARWRAASLVMGGFLVVVGSRSITLLFGMERYMLETIDAIGFALLVGGLVSLEARRREDSNETSQSRSLPVRFLVAIGARCYSLYLFHFPTLFWLAAGASVLLARPPLEFARSPTGLAAITVTLVVIFVVTEAAYRLVELPSHRLARRLGRQAAG